MPPLWIKMLLHFYSCARDYRDEVPGQHAASSAVSDFIKEMIFLDLIHETNKEWAKQDVCERSSQYSTTKKGAAMCDALMAVQIPVCKWVQP